MLYPCCLHVQVSTAAALMLSMYRRGPYAHSSPHDAGHNRPAQGQASAGAPRHQGRRAVMRSTARIFNTTQLLAKAVHSFPRLICED